MMKVNENFDHILCLKLRTSIKSHFYFGYTFLEKITLKLFEVGCIINIIMILSNFVCDTYTGNIKVSYAPRGCQSSEHNSLAFTSKLMK